MDEYVYIGKIVAAHGLEGELILTHILGKKTNFKQIKAIFIETVKNSYLPYFIQKSAAKSITETLVKFEDLSSKEEAVKLIKKNVLLTETDFQNAVSKNAPVYLTGFEVINNSGQLGIVKSVIEQPQQLLLEIIYKNKEVLIPLHEQSLKYIDRRKKIIKVELPDGLLELYTGN